MRITRSRKTRLYGLICVALAACQLEAGDGYIDTTTLLRPYRIRSVSLSPDGKYAAGLGPMEDDYRGGLVIIDLETMDVHRAFHWSPGCDIERYRWVTNEDLVFQVSRWDHFVAGMFSVNVHRDRIHPLVDDDVVCRLIDPMIDDPQYAWLWIEKNRARGDASFRLEKTGRAVVREGARQKIANTFENRLLSNKVESPPGKIHRWHMDWDHEPRLVLRYHDGVLEYVHRDRPDQAWTPLPLNAERWRVVAFTPDNRRVYVAGYGDEETKGLYIYDIDGSELGEVVFRDAEYDFVGTASFGFYQNHLVGLAYEREVPHVVWFLPQLNAIQKWVDRVLPNRINSIKDWSDDFQRHLVCSYSDVSPPEYYLLDLKERKVV